MKQRKICMLGTSSVGKTSLVRRFVQSVFSEKYHTTLGVKVDKKIVKSDGDPVCLMLWDIEGEDRFYRIKHQEMRCMAGYLLVADGTRPVSLDAAIRLKSNMASAFRDTPHFLVLNKSDLHDQWCLQAADIKKIASAGFTVISTSAKTGENVEQVFTKLVELIN